MPFGLKNLGATFQRSMIHSFHDLIHIMLVYLNNLIAWSQKQAQHIDDLRKAILQCRKYKIYLNPFNYVFCVPMGHLLGFIMSYKGMTTDPLKVRTTFPLTSPL